MENYHDLLDEQLVLLVSTKDQSLYAEIVRRYQRPLLRYARTLTGDEEGSPDIVQEAFIKAYINLRSFDTKRKFSTWIYRIVHNEAMNHIQKNKKFAHLEDEEWDAVEDNKETPDDTVFKTQLKLQVDECLKRLSVRYRTAIVLYFLEDRSYEEISDILKVPLGTVGTSINRGKKQLLQSCRQYKFHEQYGNN